MDRPPILLTFYGDDFTGSTDALEVVATAGMSAVLFLAAPSSSQIAAFKDAQIVGIAGTSRSQSPEWMSTHLPAIFESLKRLGAPICHYKVCSTFDSSPHIGSIGRAAEVGYDVFGTRPIPVVVGAPALGRYVAFGNLFARSGEAVYRIDRHPTMSRHPVTPMTESDLGRHLALQTALRSSVLGYTELAHASAAHPQPLPDTDLLIIDTIDQGTQELAGRLIWPKAGDPMRFVIGSSGVEYALIGHWQESGLISRRPPPPPLLPTDRIMVVSGSCSPTTDAQIRHALEHGFVGIPVDPASLLDGTLAMQALVDQATALLAQGRNPLLYTALGLTLPRSLRPEKELIEFNTALGERLGMLLQQVVLRSGLTRAVVAGGDTSGHVANQLGLFALTVKSSLVRGCPLCSAHSESPRFDGFELALKGGQMGGPDFFVRTLVGSRWDERK